ncbi:unnamed protein product, partial [Brenthis ino]
MAARFLVFVAIQGILLQSAFSQCINRVLPGCGPGVVDGILPNQYLIREPGLPILPAIPPAYPTVIPGSILPEGLGYAPTIIQDSSVANSLANALQLLVVSSLLSTTLPGGPCDLPCPIEYLGMPAYNYNYIY